MNAEAKTLAARMRAITDPNVEPTRGQYDALCDEAADFLDRLSAPVEGVGLTRYRITDRTYQAAAIRSLSTED